MSTVTINKAELTAQARAAYIENTNPIAIDMDGDKAFAMVPSQDGTQCYKVYFVEPKGEVPHAVSCSCPDHQYRHRECKHFEICNNYFQGIYASMKPAPRIIGNAEMDALVEQLEREFGLIEVNEAIKIKAPKKPRRSARNDALIADLQVPASVKIRKVRNAKALAVKCPATEATMSDVCPAVVTQMAA